MREDTQLIAPCTLALEVMPSNMGVVDGGDYNPAMHEIEYVTTITKVGDPSYQTATFSAPVNLSNELNRKATLYGKRINHSIMIEDVEPGSPATFEFVSWCVNLATGKSAVTNVISRTIYHPDDGFSDAETFVQREDGETGYPSTSNPLSATFSDAQNAAHAALAAGTITKARICLQAGKSGTLGRGPGDANGVCLLIDSWGAARRAIVTSANWDVIRNMGDNYLSVKVAGMETASGSVMSFDMGGNTAPIVYTFESVDTYDAPDAFGSLTSGGNANAWCAQVNCVGEGFTSTGGSFNGNMFGWCLIGCRANTRSWQSSDQKGGGGYVLRGRAPNIIVSRCDFATSQGWFINAPGIRTIQPPLRIFGTSQEHILGAYVHVERNVSEVQRLQVGETSSLPVNFVVERNHVLSGADTIDGLIDMGSPGTVRLNHLTYSPAEPPQNSDTFRTRTFVRMTQRGDDPDVLAIEGRVYSNTFVSLARDGQAITPVSAQGGLTVIEANNIVHAPYASSPVNDHAFIRLASATPRYPGYNERSDNPGPPLSAFNTTLEVQYVGGTSDLIVPGFVPGNEVRGQTTGFVKTFSHFQPRFQAGLDIMFQEPSGPYFARLDETDMEVFLPGEVLEELGSDGNPTGLTVTVDVGGSYGSAYYAGLDLIGDIPTSANPTHVVEYTGSGFEPGDVLTGGITGSTAVVKQVWLDRLWLRDVSAPFLSGEPLTSNGGGSGNAVTASALSGLGDLWAVDGNPPREGLSWRSFPYARRDMMGNERQGVGAL
ncbi:MAG: hypothetical protein AAF252_04400 [Pseudomonadota bacterium]